MSARTLSLATARADPLHGGAYRIPGTVDELGAPGRYRVRLFDRASARCIRETWSDETGAYSFDWIAYRDKGYTVIAYDHGLNAVNASVVDLVTPILDSSAVVNMSIPSIFSSEGVTMVALAQGTPRPLKLDAGTPTEFADDEFEALADVALSGSYNDLTDVPTVISGGNFD